MLDRVYSIIVALALGLLVWVYARSRERETLDNQPVSVELRLSASQADQFQMDSPAQSQIRVTFAGSPNAVRELRWQLSQGDVAVRLEYSVPEDQRERATVEDSVRVDAADILVPPGITVLPVEGRNRVPVALTRLGEKNVKVRVEGIGTEESRLKVTPEMVTVKGARVALDRLLELPLSLGAQGAESFDLTLGRPLRVALPKMWENRSITCVPDSVVVSIHGPPKSTPSPMCRFNSSARQVLPSAHAFSMTAPASCKSEFRGPICPHSPKWQRLSTSPAESFYPAPTLSQFKFNYPKISPSHKSHPAVFPLN